MEEDIKILEEFIEDCRTQDPITVYFKEECKAIENLIARYKELENFKEEYKKEINLNTEIRKLKDRIKDLEETNACLHEAAKDEFIPKSKVKEKIEELKKYRNLAKECIEERIIIADSDSLNYGRKEAHNKDIEVLQSLLEEEN